METDKCIGCGSEKKQNSQTKKKPDKSIIYCMFCNESITRIPFIQDEKK